MNDLRFAFRQIAKSPGFTAIAALSLALGIGANTVVFSWFQAVFFDPLPGVREGARLMVVESRDAGGSILDTSWSDYRDVAAQQTSFREIAATRIRALNFRGKDDRDERVWSELVSGNYFALLGVEPALGRFFAADEATRPGANAVVVISDEFWRTRYDCSPAVIGETLRLNDVAFTIIGVAPAPFCGSVVGLALEVWIPVTMLNQLLPGSKELTARDNRPLMVLADLKRGVTAAQAAAELQGIYRRLADTYPQTNTGVSPRVVPLWRASRGAQSTMLGALVTLQALVLLVLLVVCANTANLLLARATIRQKEICIRLAIGASRARIVRQLLVESIVLALLGAGGGVLLSLWGIDALYHVPIPGNLPVKVAAHLDLWGAAFSVLLGVGCAVIFGLVPALQLARADIGAALKSGGPGAGRAPRRVLRDVLVAVEVALALVVLVVAGLFLESLRNARAVSPGFETKQILLVQLDLAGRGYDKARGRRFVSELLPRLERVAGIERAAITSFVPLALVGMPSEPFGIDGQPITADTLRAYYGSVVPGYFETLRIPLLAGSDFVPLESDRQMREAIVNEAFARRCWPGASPLGRTITNGGETYEIVGLVRDAKYAALSEPPTPMVYFSVRDRIALSGLTVHVRTGGEPLSAIADVRRIIRDLDPALPVRDVRSMGQHIDQNMVMMKVPARLLTVLGPVVLLLAMIGVYGVLSFAVAQRTHEIGVRLALGATTHGVIRLIIRQGMVVVVAGVLVGLAIAYGASAYLTRILVHVPPGDVIVFASAPALLMIVALIACWLPARRATRVDPLQALRAE